MRLHTCLVLIGTTLSSICFNLLKGNSIPSTSIITTIEQALQHGDEVLIEQVVTHFATIEKTGLARKLHEEEIKKKFREEMANLENIGDGLTKEELNAHLEKYLKNIQEDPWFKTPDGKKYVELAKTTTEEIAKEPWKPSELLLLVQPLFGGAIALLVLALLLKLSA